MFFARRFVNTFSRISRIINTKKKGERLGVQGFIQNVRRMKTNTFIDVCDGSTGKTFQIVLQSSKQNSNIISVGSSVQAIGHVQLGQNGNCELHAENVNVIADGNHNAGYPFTPKQIHPPEYVRKHLHLRSRIDYIAALMRLRHRVQKYIHDYMDEEGFIHVNAPVLSTNDCEGAGEIFTVRPESEELLTEMSRDSALLPLDERYFNKKVFLTVSSQLHLEAMCYGLGSTYTLAPAFRAENNRSPLHLAEFYMLEAEIVFMDDLAELKKIIEKTIKIVTKNVLEACADDITLLRKHAAWERNKASVSSDFTWLQVDEWPTLTYDEAAEIILKNQDQFKTTLNTRSGFTKEQELFLVSHCASPVFIIDWPTAQKPFYMKTIRSNVDYVHALDLLMPRVGEMCGGSLRECDEMRLRNHPHLPTGLEWYLDLRKFGGIPTGGFGMGFERYLQLLTSVKNIRDVIPFPRYAHACKM